MVTSTFARQVGFVLGVASVLILAWRLHDVLVLTFGAVVLATAIRAGARRLEQWPGLSPRPAVVAVIVLVTLGLLLGGWLVGDPFTEQVDRLREQLPAAMDAATRWLRQRPAGQALLHWWRGLSGDGIAWAPILNAAGLTFGALGNAGLMVVLAVYLALDPRLYRQGLLRLVPLAWRTRVASALEASGEGLQRWLLGQGVSMLFVGCSTAIGLALLGMPMALTLGIIAGLMDFVPYFGPIASGLVAVLFAFGEGPDKALYVAILAVVIQQVEGNVLMPIVQRRAVELPPVLGLLSVVVFGLLFGVMGVVFATPMMVVTMILVQKLYVQQVLHDPMPATAEASTVTPPPGTTPPG
ncbi:AI-2E family transporter [uncultured Aquabacterium sp.]|uniref:AI-2E family transporter n=1 Tax=uncultured Aquabacterium sp. TaxID=158753 RepID=UPI0025EB52EF|nr:AI-2E family transporter [uncultured Aquabacterium sp.]